MSSTGLFEAIGEGRYMQVKYHVDSGVAVNCRNERGLTPLVAALYVDEAKKRRKIFHYLLKLGANFLDVDRGTTRRDVLTWACYLGRYNEVDWLVERMAGIFGLLRPDSDGRTSLHYAVLRHDPPVVERLCEAVRRFGDSSVDIYDAFGFTPFLYSLKMNAEDCEQLLLEIGGANPNQWDKQHGLHAWQWREIGKLTDTYAMRRKIAAFKAQSRLDQLRATEFDQEQADVDTQRPTIHNGSLFSKPSPVTTIVEAFHIPTIHKSHSVPVSSKQLESDSIKSKYKPRDVSAKRQGSRSLSFVDKLELPRLQPFSVVTVSSDTSVIRKMAEKKAAGTARKYKERVRDTGAVCERDDGYSSSLETDDVSTDQALAAIAHDNRDSLLMKSFCNLINVWSKNLSLEALRPDAKLIIRQKLLLEAKRQQEDAELQAAQRRSRRSSSLAAAVVTGPSSRDGRRMSMFSSPQQQHQNRRHTIMPGALMSLCLLQERNSGSRPTSSGKAFHVIQEE
jgi:hypothetical protein